MKENISIGNFVKHHRIKSGFNSQRQLAEKSGISSATISRVESEIQKPNTETLKTLSRYLRTTSLFDLMVVAEHWEKDDTDLKLVSNFYDEEHKTTEKLLYILKLLADDEGKFPSKYHEDIFDIFGGYAYDPQAIRNEYPHFNKWFFYEYLNVPKEELDEAYIDEAIGEFNKYYNYSTIKHGILNLEKNFLVINKTIEEFLEELKNLCIKHGLNIEEVKPTNLFAVSPQTVKVPILGVIACSNPILAEENILRYKNESPDELPSGNIYYVKASGNSMEPTIPDGSLVLIREQNEVEYGEIAAVLVNGNTEVTLKRVKKQGDLIMLMPDNSNHTPFIITEDNPAKIIGKAIRYTQDL